MIYYVTLKMPVVADSRIEAINLARTNKAMFPTYLEGDGYLGEVKLCEGCSKILFPDDEEITGFNVDEYGNHYCSECTS